MQINTQDIEKLLRFNPFSNINIPEFTLFQYFLLNVFILRNINIIVKILFL